MEPLDFELLALARLPLDFELLPLDLELLPRVEPLELRPLLDRPELLLPLDLLALPRELPELELRELRSLELGLDRLPPALREELPLRDCARDELPLLCRPRLLCPELRDRLL